jgi:hypothetical protein
MKLTIEFIEKHFNEFNEKFFSGELKTPVFEINRTKSFFGLCCWKNKVDDNGYVVGKFNFRIKISEYFDRSETDYINTLLHEMIHLYIRQFDLVPEYEHHGLTFKRIADKINSHGYNVVCSDSAEGVGLTNKNVVFFMVAFMDRSGRYFLIRYNPKRFEYFKHNFEYSKFTKVIWFTSTDDKKYGHLPTCRKRAGGMLITESEYNELKETVAYRETA